MNSSLLWPSGVARILVLALTFAFPWAAQAAGPGLGNLTYTSAELFKPLTIIQSRVGTEDRGEGTVQMYDGYLFVPFGKDSGVRGGGFSFYDVSNPRAPVKVSQTNVTELREPHGFGFSNSYPGRYAVMQAINGIQFWDFTNPLAPTLLKYMTLPGIAESDYDLGNWWSFWQAPYVYVGGSGNGVYVIDATDPRNPVLKNQVQTSNWGGFRVGPTFAIGNLLAMVGNDVQGLVTMDISDPINPKLIQSFKTGAKQYSGIVNGNRFITAGSDDQRLHVYDISNPANINQTAQSPDIGGRGGYVSVQDGFAHAGFSNKYAKVNLSTGAIAGTGTSNIASRDEDFGVVFGNLVLIGNDHGNGSALVPHQTAPDTTGPSVNMVSPQNGTTNQALTSRVGVSLTDTVDLRTVSNTTFIVRPRGGAALAGKYSSQATIVNFSPDVALQPGTTYDVVITAGGMKDDVGNGVPTQFTSSFTTAGTAPGATCTLNTRTAALVNSSVSFAPGSTTGSGLQYSWNFGDGTTTAFSGTSTANHTYSAVGHYSVILSVRSGSVTSTCSANQTIHTAPTAAAPVSSSTIAFDAGRNRVWVVNSDANTVTAINSSTNVKALEVPVGQNPQTIAQAPDGRIWVTNATSGTVSILNPDTGAVAQTIALAVGSKPFGVAFARNGSAAYVTLQGTGNLLKFNPTTGALLGTVAVGSSPRAIAITGDSARVFVTRFISGETQGEVKEVNAGSFAVTRTIVLATDTERDTESSGRGVPNYLSAITIQPDGKRAWIPSKKDNTLRGLFRDGNPLTFESTVRTIVSQVDLATNAEVPNARIDFNDRDMMNAVLFTPIGDYAFVSSQGVNMIEVVDTYTGQISTGIINVGRAPRGMLITPSGRLFVQNFMSRSVSVYDVNGILNSTSGSAPQLANIATVASETLPANVLLGKQIFYNADDRRMNRDKYISCASCHQDGGHDGRVLDFTDRGEGLRNSIALNGRRGVGQGRVHWTGNFNEIQDFENDIRNAFGGTGFMTDAQFNTGTRSQPLGDNKAGVSADLDALSAYVSSLTTVGQSPHRNPDGSLTASGAAGKVIFEGTGQCVTCHSGADFTNSAGSTLHDVGTIKASSGKRLGATLTGFDTPTLKGVWDTAPYLHDGSAATLLDVLNNAKTTGKHGNVGTLTAAQMNDLVSYLQQIDDTGVAPSVAISNLSAKDTANAADWSVQANLQVGNVAFGDRTYTMDAVPAEVAGAAWVKTANDSKTFAGNPTVTFDLSVAATVYVAVDDRGGKPTWMDASWTDSGVNLVVRENATTTRAASLFKKSFAAGAVSLGANPAGGSMYTVVVK